MKSAIWALGLVLTASLAGKAAAADRWEKTFPISGKPTLHIVTGDGSVRVETWDRKAVGVLVTSTYRRIGPRGVEVDARQDGDRIDVRLRERQHRRFGVYFSVGKSPIQVEIQIPREATVDITTGDGSVTVAPLSGQIALRTGDGRITADGLEGEIVLESGDGTIVATNLDGRVRAQTGDGGVRIDGRFDGLDLGSGDGRIHVVARRGSHVRDGWSVETGDGPLELRIPAELDAELDVHTDDGHIDLELPLQATGRVSRGTIHGNLNRGGAPLRIRSGDGSIRIGRL